MKNLHSFKTAFLKLFVCPICKGKLNLRVNNKRRYLFCTREKKKYPIIKVTYLGEKKKIFVEVPFLYVGDKIVNPKWVRILDNKKIKLAVSKKVFYKLLAKKLESFSRKDIIIDNGCGTNILKEFTNKKITGFDCSIRDACSPIDFVANSMFVPIKDNGVDCYVSNFVMEYIDRPNLYVGEMYRTLKKGGFAYIALFTAYSYIGFFISIGTYYNYLKKIKNESKSFLRNPIRHFLYGFTRGTKNKTFIEEMRKWKLSYFEDVFKKEGFEIIKKEFIGNLLSMDWVYNPISSKLKNYGKKGVICLYTLKK